jgi:putative salt-induced outer membrane protein
MSEGFLSLILKWIYIKNNKTYKGNTMKKLLLLSLATASFLMAAEKSDAFISHSELGFNKTSGNTDTTTLNLDGKAEKNLGKHAFTASIDGQYAENNGVESKNKFVAELNYDYALTDRLDFNYLAGYKDDKFSRFDYQIYTGPGAKYLVFKDDIHNLTVDGNLLYAKDSIARVNYDAAGDIIKYPNADNIATVTYDPSYTESYAAYRLKGVYERQLLENLKFGQELSYRSSFKDQSNFFIYSKTGLSTKLSTLFSAGVSYKLDYVNLPGDKEKTDTTLTANLIMDY